MSTVFSKNQNQKILQLLRKILKDCYLPCHSYGINYTGALLNRKIKAVVSKYSKLRGKMKLACFPCYFYNLKSQIWLFNCVNLVFLIRRDIRFHSRIESRLNSLSTQIKNVTIRNMSVLILFFKIVSHSFTKLKLLVCLQNIQHIYG